MRATITADLPPPLRRLRQDAPKQFAGPEAASLKIAFPPDGARIDLGLKEGMPDHPLALKALGGAPPFTWFVNGAPVGEAEIRRQSLGIRTAQASRACRSPTPKARRMR